jgi:heat shock protein HslJ
MSEQNWLRIGAIALAVVGFLILIGWALGSSGDIEGETFVVEELVVDGATTVPIPGTLLTAFFEDGTVSGVAGCNNYFAGYEIDGSSIEIGPAGSTQAFCSEPDGVMDQEFAYLALLQSADHYELDGDRLTLSQGGAPLLVYNVARAELLEQ